MTRLGAQLEGCAGFVVPPLKGITMPIPIPGTYNNKSVESMSSAAEEPNSLEVEPASHVVEVEIHGERDEKK